MCWRQRREDLFKDEVYFLEILLEKLGNDEAV